MAETSKKYLNLEMKDIYCSKKDCVSTAESIIDDGRITGMSVRQMAAEIYTHAFIYRVVGILPAFIRNISIVRRIYNSAANGIDLEDNGDSLKRRICYSVIWCLC